MQSTYLYHYWSLYLDFIHAFQNLRYKKIPLPLLSNFYQYIDEHLKQQMMGSDFKTYLKTKNLTEEQIQPHFERWLHPVQIPLKTKPITGNILLNSDYLRLNFNILSTYFNPQKTIILARREAARGQKLTHSRIPIHSIQHYTLTNPSLTQKHLKKAEQLFLSYQKHPAFSNQNLQNRFLHDIPIMIERLIAIENLFDQVPISCIIVGTTEEIISRILTIVAASRGIPSICLQHGLVMGEEAYLPIFASKQGVYGEYEKDWYMSKGVSAERIEIIGHPRFDDIFEQKRITKKEFEKKFGLTATKTKVFVATQHINASDWVKLLENLAQDSSIEIILKPHPWEIGKGKVEHYEKLNSKYESIKILLSRKENLYDILPHVDVAVIGSSTVGIEAMLFDKPVVVLKKKLPDRDYKYYDKMGEFSQSDPLAAADLVRQLIHSPTLREDAALKRKAFITYAYPETLSGKRLLQLINSLTG